MLFLFDRTTGKPLFPIEYRKVPPSDVDGEVAAETQPFPLKPVPFARQLLTEDLITNRTPEAHRWALERFRTFQSAGQFVPFTVGKDTVIFPGYDGGAEFGGSAFDPDTGVLYVNANDLAWTGALALNTAGPNAGRQIYDTQCAQCHGADRNGTGAGPPLTGIAAKKTAAEITAIVQNGGGRMPGFSTLNPQQLRAVVQFVSAPNTQPAAAATPSPIDLKYRFTGYNKWLDPDGYPATAPPWGTLNAINLHTGEYAWKVPLGEYPELAAKGMKDTGSENYGGPVVTAGGLVFIAATNFDRKLRAFDKSTGKLLWETEMANSANSTPAVYEVNGRQFIALAAFGGKGRPNQNGGAIVAYALPSRR
jgi:quinoprotein glucose dehydrogenase